MTRADRLAMHADSDGAEFGRGRVCYGVTREGFQRRGTFPTRLPTTKDLSVARPEDWGIWTACPKPDHRVPTKLDSEPASSDF